ncbi:MULTISPECIES: cbb3-type cytochrome oxidase subunit 3 [Hydrogenophaga]|nr:cbb3-type cytochrome c oxidase subunit 3 [Hydrogenophaga intermedia]TMU77229.1 cbb3-type cytochrome c oxidase subunit 3 [Hydrogenophaga intermedia]
MDINTLRSVVTVISLLAFVGIVAWAWSRRNRERFDEAARLPFQDE